MLTPSELTKKVLEKNRNSSPQERKQVLIDAKILNQNGEFVKELFPSRQSKVVRGKPGV